MYKKTINKPSDLACIFGIYFSQISKLPSLLSLVKVTFV